MTRYIRAEQVPLLEGALAGYAQFQALVEQYAQAVIARTREQLAVVGAKKKEPAPPRRTCTWHTRRKSSR